MGLNIAGILVLLAFYILVLAVGIIAARKFKVKGNVSQKEISIVAGREINTIVGIFTMAATTIGGGYINGTAESIATQGLVWTLPPFGIFIGLILGGLFFAKPMRDREYMTMLDPFQQRYGDTVTGLMYITSFVGDVFWSASILAALGTSLSVIIGLDVNVSIITSSAIAIVYTIFGQMISVAYTDIVQLVMIVCGLLLATPFALTHDSAGDLTENVEWLGKPLASVDIASWIDFLIAMTLGSIPWQSYFQRVLSVKGSKEAQILSVVGATSALLLAVPPALIGAVGTTADWNATGLGQSPVEKDEARMILPYVLYYFTPRPVAVIGLGAISAAVMSSTDSAILGSSSMFTHNVYHGVIRKKASEKEILWVQRITVLCLGVIASTVALLSGSVYNLFILAADLVFVIIMPQLICVLHMQNTNVFGALSGYILGLLLRFGSGEHSLGLPPLIIYPWYDDKQKRQLFPFRTFIFIVSLVVICVLSHAWIFLRKKMCIFSTEADNSNINRENENKYKVVHDQIMVTKL